MVGVTSGRLERLERFLDDLDNVKNPYSIEEPFRTLWFRVHGQDPGKVSDGGELPSPSAMIDSDALGTGTDRDDIEVSPASKESIKGLEDGSKKGRIEIISPKEIGPTIEMKIQEKKKVTFKAAVGDDLKAAKTKEDAAKRLMDIQNMASPLKGMGGDAGKIYDTIKEMALFYRDGSYEQVNDLAKEIEERLDEREFMKSVFLYLKGKIDDYEKVGGDLTRARESYKELATSLKGQRDDFIPLVGACNSLVEDSVKDILSESTSVEVVSVKPLPGKSEKKAVTPQKKIGKPKVAVKKIIKKPAPKPTLTVKKAVEKPEQEKQDFEMEVPVGGKISPAKESPKESEPQVVSDPLPEQRPQETEKVKPLPIIKTKVVKKKLVTLVPKTEVPEESTEPKPETTPPQPKQDKPKKTSTPVPEGEQKASPQKEAVVSPQLESQPKPEDVPSEAVDGAFKKIQFVYDVAMKMHSNGKDVSQIFDMLNYAEKVRAEGKMKTYIGVSDQCETMVIELQNK
ncbi:MAG: hypothetical protein KAH57_07455 [Thermoplasmata archaeon]|nr:hypothetical protein [Thermoplasmata archaeon]